MEREIKDVLEDLAGHMAYAIERLARGTSSEQGWAKSLKSALGDVRAMATATKAKLAHPALKHVEVLTGTGHD